MCVHEHTLHKYTQNYTSIHSHARDTSRVYFVIHLTCIIDIGMHGRQQKLAANYAMLSIAQS